MLKKSSEKRGQAFTLQKILHQKLRLVGQVEFTFSQRDAFFLGKIFCFSTQTRNYLLFEVQFFLHKKAQPPPKKKILGVYVCVLNKYVLVFLQS